MPDRIRVAFYSGAREIGGAEASLASLVGGLNSSMDAVVVGTDRRVVEWIVARQRATKSVLLPAIERKWNVRAFVAHVRAFRRLRPNIVHVNVNVSGASPWAILAARIVPGVRVVAVEHLPYPIPRRRRRLLGRVVSRFLAAHVAVGDRAAAETARFIGIPPAAVRTIHNGVREIDLEPLPRPVGGSIVGSVGRLDEQKAYDVLVRALPELPDVTAVIVGEGSERDRLAELAHGLGVSERLVLTGWSAEARRHLTTFDVFVLPSRFEGLPLVLIEAMLAGLPVVATDVGGVAEVVVDGTTGILVEPEDPAGLARAVETLVQDAELRRTMGDRGRRRARELFTVELMVSRYEALYHEVVR